MAVCLWRVDVRTSVLKLTRRWRNIVRIWLVIWLHVWVMRYRDVGVVLRMWVVRHMVLRRILLGRSDIVIVLLPPRVLRWRHHRPCRRLIHANGGWFLLSSSRSYCVRSGIVLAASALDREIAVRSLACTQDAIGYKQVTLEPSRK